MAVETRIGEEAYLRFALDATDGQWELHDGQLVEKPGMTWEHDDVMSFLGYLLQHQLDRTLYRVRINAGRLRRSPANYFIPDVAVVPAALGDVWRNRPGTLVIFRDPLPLVVEIWSRSTGGYDVDTKLPEYEARGDEEIWRLHPYERTLVARRRQPDGSYLETRYTGGTVAVESLPGVEIDLDVLFTG